MLNRYLHRLYDSILSRGYIEVEHLIIDNRSNRRGTIRGRLKFPDSSLLSFGEVLIVKNRRPIKLRYTYHYQSASGEVIFRYDNAPHYPNITILLPILTINTSERPLSLLLPLILATCFVKLRS